MREEEHEIVLPIYLGNCPALQELFMFFFLIFATRK